jgi:hypothetical protein
MSFRGRTVHPAARAYPGSPPLASMSAHGFRYPLFAEGV